MRLREEPNRRAAALQRRAFQARTKHYKKYCSNLARKNQSKLRNCFVRGLFVTQRLFNLQSPSDLRFAELRALFWQSAPDTEALKAAATQIASRGAPIYALLFSFFGRRKKQWPKNTVFKSIIALFELWRLFALAAKPVEFQVCAK